jgi:hypothetical protein
VGFVAFSSRRSRVTCVMTPVLRGGACPCGPRPQDARASSSEYGNPSVVPAGPSRQSGSAGGTQAAVGIRL